VTKPGCCGCERGCERSGWGCSCTLRGVKAVPATTDTTLRAPIGVFDSGVGGLTVLKTLRERLPQEDFIYLADTARVPYGRKPPAMVRDFALQIGRFLVDEGVKAIVIACNTASSCALADLQQQLPVPVWGVIEPGVQSALAVSRGGTVGVIGTKGTIASGAYQKRLEHFDLDVWARACPLLAPIVEEGLFDAAEAEVMVEHYLKDRPQLDALILGCTHYPILKPVIADIVGPGVCLVDSAEAVSAVVARDLSLRGCLQPSSKNTGEVIHYITGDPASYQHTSRFIGGVAGEFRLLEIERLLSKQNQPRTNDTVRQLV
jgi:glutamate racemase